MGKLCLAALCCVLIMTPLSACVAPGGTTAPAAVALAPTQARYVAEIAYAGWAIAAKGVLANPAATPEVKAKVKATDTRAYAALQAARLGTASADAVLAIIGEAQTFMPKVN